jgi:ATP-dependent DNA helicase RecG
MENTVLGQILEQGESDRVEFLSGVDLQSRVEEASCAFLNGQGGILVAGVKDDGRLVGVPAAEAKARALQQHLLAAISPPAPLSVTVEDMRDKKLVVVDVPQGLEKPYICKGKIMVRRGTAIVPAVANDISSLIGQRALAEARWERLPALGAEEDDLGAGLIRKVAETIKERRGFAIDPRRKPAKVLERLGLVRAGQLTNAALVLFGKDPAQWYPQTRVRAAHFRGHDRTEFLDNQVFEGSLFSLLEGLAAFVQSHTPVSSRFDRDDLQRRDQLAYPLHAVREAIVNALVHRDYSAFDGGMSIAVYDGRIEFWNSGALPDEMTVDDLRTTHPSRPINPDIAQVCFLYGLMERWGIGTQKIIRACLQHGLPEPEWRVDRNGVILTLRRMQEAPSQTAADGLNLRLLSVARRLRAGERLKVADYLKLVSAAVKERQARIDLNHLTEAGYLQRVGAGPATMYIRTAKRVPELPAEEGSEG